MKKETKKLELKKETITILDNQQSSKVLGGWTTDDNHYTTDEEYHTDGCYTETWRCLATQTTCQC